MLLVLPAVFALVVLNYYPILQSLTYTFFELSFTTDWLNAPFIGLANYATVFASDQFWYTFGFTLGFTIVVVCLDLTIGMLLALSTFYVERRYRALLRAIIIIPWAIPKIIQASMWRWLLNSEYGPIGALLVGAGLVEQPPLFLVNSYLAISSVVVTYSWRGASVAAFFLMGGLAMIPRDILESARVDGAGAFRRFFLITLPVLMPTVSVALLYRSQDALRVFDTVYGLTGGGPGTMTDTLSTFAYTAYFQYSQFGRASTYAVVTFLLVAFVGIFYISRIKRSFNFRE